METIQVNYIDEENDAVEINSEEELCEAFKVARRFNNTLSLKVYSAGAPGAADAGVTEDTLNVKADVDKQSVEMKVTAPEAGMDCSPPGEAKMDDNCVIIDVEDDVEQPQEGAKAAATCLLPQGSSGTARKLVWLRHTGTGLVLDVQGGGVRADTPVIVWEKKPQWQGINNQLWYEEAETGTLRTLLNDFCLDVTGDRAVVTPFLLGRGSQQWRVAENQIQHRGNPENVLGASTEPRARLGKVFIAAAADMALAGWMAETWEPKKTNKETGEKFQPPHDARTSHREKVKGYYAHLAKNAGKMYGPGKVKTCRGKPGPRGGEQCYESGEKGAGRAEDNPAAPAWFLTYMERFKSDIGEDMARLVARKTVKHVLQGLEGAVITSVHGTPGSSAAPTPTIPAQQAAEADEPVYHHYGIVCDHCEREIVGVRYKCGNCADYDLCEECEALGDVHHPEHVFLKIRRPMLQAGRMRRDGRRTPLLRKTIYTGDDEESRRLENESNRREERLKRKSEKMEERMRKQEEKQKHREDKLKRRLEQNKDRPHKKEKLDLPQFKSADRMDAFFVEDETFPDGTRVQPGSKLVKKWLMRNSGTGAWSSKTMLCMMYGNMAPVRPEVSVPYLQPGEEGTLTVELVAPDEPGTYQSHWRLAFHGARFGHRVWSQIVVDPKIDLEASGESSSVNLNVVGDTGKDEDEEEEEEEGFAEEQEENPEDTDANTVEAAAHLATCTAGGVTRVIDAEILTAQDLLSFELLDIRERGKAKLSQTATPNNTPLVASPPKSPTPESEMSEILARLSSNSSSVEVVSESGVSPDNEESQALMTSLVQERMASIGLRPDVEPADMADIESLSSLSDDSTDSDNDFYIVPIPDCFIPQLPASKAASTSVYVKKADKSVDEMLTASANLETEPLLSDRANATFYDAVESVDTVKGACGSADSEKQPDVVVKVTLPTDEPDQEELPTPAADEPEPTTAPPRAGTPEEEAGAPRAEAAAPLRAVAAPLDSDSENDDGSDENANLPIDYNHNESPVPTVQPSAEEMSPDRHYQGPSQDLGGARPRTGAQQRPTGELVSSIMTTALGVAGHAAATAYTTAKDVFHTLQARNQYVPPKSDWNAPKNEWEPKQSEWSPPAQDWTPSKEEWTPPKEWTPPQEWTPLVETEPEPDVVITAVVPAAQATPMERLVEMGFGDRILNRRLLDKHGDNMEKVVQELIQISSTDWPARRH